MSFDFLTDSAKLRKSLIYILYFSIFCFSISIRLYNLTLVAPVTDERLWTSRGYRLIEHLSKDPLEYSSHLRHPGLPAATLIGAAQKTAEKINKYFYSSDSQESNTEPIDSLDASRFIIALLSSLLPLIVFWGSKTVLGFPIAFFSAAILMVEPYILANSRIAHLDASLSVFVACSLFSYTYAVRHSKLIWKFVAGVFFGFSIKVGIGTTMANSFGEP